MPYLLDLANEILYQIITATSPHDIESLAASCRTINTLAKPRIKRHHELKKKYSRLAFRDCEETRYMPAVHPIYLLRDVLQDATVAQYPTSIRGTYFSSDYDEWYDNDLDIDEWEAVKAAAVECESEIINAIYQSPFIEILERETWKVEIMRGNGEATLGLLLTLLPCLTSMLLVQRPEGFIMKMLKRIVEFQQPPQTHAPQALTKLTRIDTTPYYSGDEMGMVRANEFDYVAQYMLLPSMRSITGSDLDTVEEAEDQKFQWRHNLGVSDVREINLARSSVDGKSITNLLRGVRALEKFSFSCNACMYTRPVYQPRRIINGLKQYAKCSLSYLRLTGIRGKFTVEIDDLEYDLRSFEKLKQLHIEHKLLSHHGRPCMAASSGKSSQCSGVSNQCNCWPQRLVDVLPASLESLKLVGSVPWKRVKAFFAGFSELKAERLPRLREIEMQGSAAADMRFVHLCNEVGVVLRRSDHYLAVM